MKIKGILLDIDDTLYDYNKSHLAALSAVFNKLKKSYNIDRKRFKYFYEKAKFQIHTELKNTASCHNRLLYFQRMFELLSVNSLKDTSILYDIYWNTFLKNLAPYRGVYDFLDAVKKFKICFVSDLTADVQHRKIRKMRLFKYDSILVTSEEAGIEKPHPAIFRLALKKLRLKPSEVCMIGDNYERDIAGAAKLSIRSLWFNKGGKIKIRHNPRVAEFRNFKELQRYFQ